VGGPVEGRGRHRPRPRTRSGPARTAAHVYVTGSSFGGRTNAGYVTVAYRAAAAPGSG